LTVDGIAYLFGHSSIDGLPFLNYNMVDTTYEWGEQGCPHRMPPRAAMVSSLRSFYVNKGERAICVRRCAAAETW
jgi:hypothetical protein